MHIDRILRLLAGAFTLISLALAHYHHPGWLWFTAFVGLNLFQTGFTTCCPMRTILDEPGVPKLARHIHCKRRNASRSCATTARDRSWEPWGSTASPP